MAGLCGTVGEDPPSPDAMVAGLEWTGTEHTVSYDDDGVSIRGSVLDAGEATVAERGEAAVLTWGELYGFDGPDGYVPRPADGRSTADYLAGLYERHGLDAVSGLNGEFVAAIHDRSADTVHLCTDRLAIRDTYYTRVSGDRLAFSTRIQSLSLLPDVTPSFARDMVREYFVARRTYGVRTPLEGTYLLGPGSVMTVDLSTHEHAIDRYWRPRFRPAEKPFSHFVEELVSRLRAAIAERTRHHRDYGVLLSGGSDSRLVLAAVREQGPATAYHMGDWMNDEARTAERVALTASAEFEFLRRDEDYQVRALRRTPALSNFVGRFNQAHAEGFLDRIRTEVDVLFDGQVANHLFRGTKVPRYRVDVPKLGRLDLPFRKPMDTIEAFVESVDDDPPPYLVDRRGVRDLLREHVYHGDDGVHHHGLTYDAPRDLFLFGDFVPITNKNGFFMAQSIRQHLAHASPFLDNRLVDLALSMPIRYRVRRDPVNAALRRMAPELAAIPHAGTGVKPSRPYPVQYVEGNARGLYRKYRRSEDRLPRPHLSHGPWPDKKALLREHPAFGETLRSHEDTVKALPFLDWEGVLDCFEAHERGADRSFSLYRLLTFLEMPVTDRVVRSMDS